VFDETNGSQVEQVDLDEIGDEEAPCITLRNMSIGDVCPKESEEPPNAQDQPSSSTQASPPTQNEMKLKLMKEKINKMSHLKMMAMIKGEMQRIKTRRMRNQDRHTQESTKQSNEITPSTPSLATFIRG
jgi:TolA-binding protein